MPGEGLTHGPPATRNAGGSHHRISRTSGIPCAVAYGLYALSLGTGLIAPLRNALPHWRTASAPGGQDHTTSPSASSAVRPTASMRPPHPALDVRDDAYAPQ